MVRAAYIAEPAVQPMAAAVRAAESMRQLRGVNSGSAQKKRTLNSAVFIASIPAKSWTSS